MSVSPKFCTSQGDSIGADWFGPHVSVPPTMLRCGFGPHSSSHRQGRREERLQLMGGDSDSKFYPSFALIASSILGTSTLIITLSN
jgi:hypothetical protein